jgi:hypothetical protein
MARVTVPVIEVTAPDGTRSFWGAYSVPHNQAVAAVKSKLPARFTVELSVRRLPLGWRLDGARPGDIVRLDYETAPGRRVRSTSARSASFLGELLGTAMEDLDKIAAQLTAAVRKMPPGHRRQDALREIGRLRSRMRALLRSTAKSGEAAETFQAADAGE